MPRKMCKFRKSQNSTKFDILARFREKIPTVKSVSSSEIKRINFRFFTEIMILPFLRKLDFLGSYNPTFGRRKMLCCFWRNHGQEDNNQLGSKEKWHLNVQPRKREVEERNGKGKRVHGIDEHFIR